MNEGCLKRTATGHAKEASALIYLIEELGDARLRCDQLVRYITEAFKLVESSGQKEQLFEVGGHLIHAIPDALFRLNKALQAVALAAGHMDSEELKSELRPEKVQELERVLQEVRIRHVQRRSQPKTAPPSLDVQTKQEKLRQLKAQLEGTTMKDAIADLKNHLQRMGLVASDEPNVGRLERMISSTEDQLKEMKHSLDLYKRDPGKYKPQLENFAAAVRTTSSVAQATLRTLGKTASSDDEEKLSRYEEGKPADPTSEMSDEDAKKWKNNTEKYKDKFKAASKADFSKLHHEMQAHLDTFDMAWSRYERDPVKNRAQLDAALRYMESLHFLAGVLIRNMTEMQKVKTAAGLKSGAGELPQYVENLLPRLILEVFNGAKALREDGTLDPLMYYSTAGNLVSSLSRLFRRGTHDRDVALLLDKAAALIASLTERYQYSTGWDAEPMSVTAAGELSGMDQAVFELDELKSSAVRALRAATGGRWKMSLLNLGDVVESVGQVLVHLGDKEGITKSTPLLREVRETRMKLPAGQPVLVPGETRPAFASTDEEKLSRFEEGVHADPTQAMDPEDAKKWKENTEKHKDKFKSATDDDEEKMSRYEEGVKADPTLEMSEIDAKKWKENTEKHKDKFKAAAVDTFDSDSWKI